MDLMKVSIIDIELFDLFGKMLMKKGSLPKGSGHQVLSIDLKELHLAGGLYFCKIKVGEEMEVIKKLLVR